MNIISVNSQIQIEFEKIQNNFFSTDIQLFWENTEQKYTQRPLLRSPYTSPVFQRNLIFWYLVWHLIKTTNQSRSNEADSNKKPTDEFIR